MSSPSHREAICEMVAASFHHPRRGAVEGVNLRLRPGELVGIAGAVGSGKSLVLRGAVGLEHVPAGEVRLFGHSLAKVGYDELLALRQRTALASLTASLLSNLTVRQNIEVPLIMRGASPSKAEARASEVLDALGILASAELRLHQFSLGVLCQANVARALALDAELYVLDEPSRGQSSAQLDALTRLIDQRRQQGAAVLVGVGDLPRWAGTFDAVLHLGDTPT